MPGAKDPSRLLYHCWRCELDQYEKEDVRTKLYNPSNLRRHMHEWHHSGRHAQRVLASYKDKGAGMPCPLCKKK